jgi:hypothetical protein
MTNPLHPPHRNKDTPLFWDSEAFELESLESFVNKAPRAHFCTFGDLTCARKNLGIDLDQAKREIEYLASPLELIVHQCEIEADRLNGMFGIGDPNHQGEQVAVHDLERYASVYNSLQSKKSKLVKMQRLKMCWILHLRVLIALSMECELMISSRSAALAAKPDPNVAKTVSTTQDLCFAVTSRFLLYLHRKACPIFAPPKKKDADIGSQASTVPFLWTEDLGLKVKSKYEASVAEKGNACKRDRYGKIVYGTRLSLRISSYLPWEEACEAAVALNLLGGAPAARSVDEEKAAISGACSVRWKKEFVRPLAVVSFLQPLLSEVVSDILGACSPDTLSVVSEDAAAIPDDPRNKGRSTFKMRDVPLSFVGDGKDKDGDDGEFFPFSLWSHPSLKSFSGAKFYLFAEPPSKPGKRCRNLLPAALEHAGGIRVYPYTREASVLNWYANVRSPCDRFLDSECALQFVAGRERAFRRATGRPLATFPNRDDSNVLFEVPPPITFTNNVTRDPLADDNDDNDDDDDDALSHGSLSLKEHFYPSSSFPTREDEFVYWPEFKRILVTEPSQMLDADGVTESPPLIGDFEPNRCNVAGLRFLINAKLKKRLRDAFPDCPIVTSRLSSKQGKGVLVLEDYRHQLCSHGSEASGRACCNFSHPPIATPSKTTGAEGPRDLRLDVVDYKYVKWGGKLHRSLLIESRRLAPSSVEGRVGRFLIDCCPEGFCRTKFTRCHYVSLVNKYVSKCERTVASHVAWLLNDRTDDLSWSWYQPPPELTRSFGFAFASELLSAAKSQCERCGLASPRHEEAESHWLPLPTLKSNPRGSDFKPCTCSSLELYSSHSEEENEEKEDEVMQFVFGGSGCGSTLYGGYDFDYERDGDDFDDPQSDVGCCRKSLRTSDVILKDLLKNPATLREAFLRIPFCSRETLKKDVENFEAYAKSTREKPPPGLSKDKKKSAENLK